MKQCPSRCVRTFSSKRDRLASLLRHSEDATKERTETIRKKLIQWEPLVPYTDLISVADEKLLDDLDYIRVMYSRPLGPESRCGLYPKIMKGVENAKSATEENMFMSLALYYNLV